MNEAESPKPKFLTSPLLCLRILWCPLPTPRGDPGGPEPFCNPSTTIHGIRRDDLGRGVGRDGEKLQMSLSVFCLFCLAEWCHCSPQLCSCHPLDISRCFPSALADPVIERPQKQKRPGDRHLSRKSPSVLPTISTVSTSFPDQSGPVPTSSAISYSARLCLMLARPPPGSYP